MDEKECIEMNTLSLPDEIVEWIGNAAVYESSGHSGAQTVYVDRDGGAYLKIAARGMLYRSAIMQNFYYWLVQE